MVICAGHKGGDVVVHGPDMRICRMFEVVVKQLEICNSSREVQFVNEHKPWPARKHGH